MTSALVWPTLRQVLAGGAGGGAVVAVLTGSGLKNKAS
jgi:hypothetical protein